MDRPSARPLRTSFLILLSRRIYVRWLVVVLVVLVSVYLLRHWWVAYLPPIWGRTSLQLLVDRIGWWGPALLISVNIVQIVVAPIPGYGVYLVAGALYGPWWGGLWATIGLMTGGMAAMMVGRKWGRPAVRRLIGEKQLDRWDRLTGSNSIVVWAIVLLSPIGDAPFLLAGLSQISYLSILVLTMITRAPAAFLVAAIGAGVLQLSWWQLTLLGASLALPLVLLYRYQRAIMAWCGALIERFIT